MEVYADAAPVNPCIFYPSFANLYYTVTATRVFQYP